MANSHNALIQNIIELSNGTIEEQLKACNKVSKIVKNTDAAKSEKLLPILIKFMSSSDCRLQKNAVNLIAAIMNFQENIQFFIESDAISKFVQLLSTSEDQRTLIECLNCLLIIAISYPFELPKFSAVPQLVQLIKRNNSQISYKALQILKNISKENQNIDDIIAAESIQFLVNILSSKNIDSIKEAIEILTNIASYNYDSCKFVLGYGTLNLIKTNLNHPALKMVALNFIKKILFTEEEIDEIIDKCIILSILKVLSSRDSAEIKNIAVNIIQAVVEKKPLYCPTLINDGNDILSLLSDLLESDDYRLLMSSLTTLKSIVDTIGCQIINEKLKHQITELSEHEYYNIKTFSTEIFNIIIENNVQQEKIAEIKVKAEIKTEIEDEQYYQITNAQVEKLRSINFAAMGSNSLIDQIAQLANGNVKDQWEFIVKINNAISTKALVLESCVVSQLQPIIVKFIKSNNDLIREHGERLMMSIIYGTNVSLTIDADGIESIIYLLQTTDISITIYTLEALINFISCSAVNCQIVLDQHGIINMIKKFFKKVSFIRLLAYQFIFEITKFGEKHIDFIIAEGFIQIIFQKLKDQNKVYNYAPHFIPFDIKVISFCIFKNVIAHKPKYFLTWINEQNLISILLNNLQQPNSLIINGLSLLNDIIEKFGYRQIEKELVANWGKTKIQNLLRHENEKVRELAVITNDLFDTDMRDAETVVNDEERESTVGFNVASNKSGSKRLSSFENSVEPHKRARISTECLMSDTVDGDEGYDDYDDHSEFRSTTSDGMEIKPYPLHPPPEILLNLPEDEPTPEFDNIPQSNNTFDPFKYYIPPESFLDSICEKIGLNFDRTIYFQLYSNIKMKHVSTTSMPATTLPSNEKSGFNCFSLFLTGEENHAEKIREEIIKHFMDLNKNEILDEEKEAEIRGNSITNEHLRTIASLWKCKIMVYFDDYWQLFGNWEDKTAPVFVLQKEIVDDQICYQIVTSLFD